jgi:DNA-binding beta-propeller fold protein YncE
LNFTATSYAHSPPTQSLFYVYLYGIALDSVNQFLYVTDDGNNRVLVFNVAPGTIANGENASYVLGQASFTTATAAATQSGLSSPTGLAFDPVNSRLFVADEGNNRVMVFPTAATGGPLNGNGENASYVLGQANFTTNGAGAGTAQMNQPFRIHRPV